MSTPQLASVQPEEDTSPLSTAHPASSSGVPKSQQNQPVPDHQQPASSATRSTSRIVSRCTAPPSTHFYSQNPRGHPGTSEAMPQQVTWPCLFLPTSTLPTPAVPPHPAVPSTQPPVIFLSHKLDCVTPCPKPFNGFPLLSGSRVKAFIRLTSRVTWV